MGSFILHFFCVLSVLLLIFVSFFCYRVIKILGMGSEKERQEREKEQKRETEKEKLTRLMKKRGMRNKQIKHHVP